MTRHNGAWKLAGHRVIWCPKEKDASCLHLWQQTVLDEVSA